MKKHKPGTDEHQISLGFSTIESSVGFYRIKGQRKKKLASLFPRFVKTFKPQGSKHSQTLLKRLVENHLVAHSSRDNICYSLAQNVPF